MSFIKSNKFFSEDFSTKLVLEAKSISKVLFWILVKAVAKLSVIYEFSFALSKLFISINLLFSNLILNISKIFFVPLYLIEANILPLILFSLLIVLLKISTTNIIPVDIIKPNIVEKIVYIMMLEESICKISFKEESMFNSSIFLSVKMYSSNIFCNSFFGIKVEIVKFSTY